MVFIGVEELNFHHLIHLVGDGEGERVQAGTIVEPTMAEHLFARACHIIDVRFGS